MKTVLLITRDFSPYCGPTGWMVRCVSLANFLSEQGYKVVVVATKRSRELNNLTVNSDVDVHWVKNIFHYYFSHHNPLLKLFLVYPAIHRLFNFILGKPFYDNDLSALPQYRRKIRALEKKYKFDHIVISTPPHSLQLLMQWLRERYPSATLISDLRDAWSFRPMYQGNKKQLKSIRRKEDQIFNLVDYTVHISEGMANIYSEKYGLNNTVVVENGFLETENEAADPEFENSIKQFKKEGKIILGYFGSGSVGMPTEHKDLSRLFDAIESNPLLFDNFAVVIQGNIKGRSGFKSTISYRLFSPTSINQVHSHMGMVDLGLSVFTDPPYYAPAVVTAKTYEYILCGIPVLGIADENAVSLKKILDEIGGYFADVYDRNKIVLTLKQILEEYKSDPAGFNDLVVENRHRFSREYQYRKYLEILK